MDMDRLPRMLLTSWCPTSRVIGRPRMSFGHTIKKFIIKLNDKLDDPDAKAWDPKLKGTAARKEQWRWTELAKKENKDQWRKIIRRTDEWREREREEAEAKAAAARGGGVGGRHATLPRGVDNTQPPHHHRSQGKATLAQLEQRLTQQLERRTVNKPINSKEGTGTENPSNKT